MDNKLIHWIPDRNEGKALLITITNDKIERNPILYQHGMTSIEFITELKRVNVRNYKILIDNTHPSIIKELIDNGFDVIKLKKVI